MRAGWLIKEGGTWTLTEEGIKALDLYKDPLEFYRRASQLYRQWHKSHKGHQLSLQDLVIVEEDVEDESEKIVSVSYEEARVKPH